MPEGISSTNWLIQSGGRDSSSRLTLVAMVAVMLGPSPTLSVRRLKSMNSRAVDPRQSAFNPVSTNVHRRCADFHLPRSGRGQATTARSVLDRGDVSAVPVRLNRQGGRGPLATDE